MSVTGGTLAALVAASVTQLIQFGGSFFWSRHVLEAQGTVRVAPLEVAGTGLRYCLAEDAVPEAVACTPATPGFLQDPGKQEVLLGSNALTFVVGAFLSAVLGCRRCLSTSTRPPPVGHHGRGAAFRNQRTGGRGRLRLAGAGALGSALVLGRYGVAPEASAPAIKAGQVFLRLRLTR